VTPQRWHQIEEIFARAESLDAARRADFLDEACAGDAELRDEVESLLAAAATPDRRVDQPIVSLREPLEPSIVGRRIGPYRVLEEIGRGGLGAVYRAAREDGEVDQVVAIKRIKRGMDTDEVLRRFRAERQILANLDHPGIARFLDAGTAEDDRPYFVMEYVDGERLDDYCKTQALSIEERLGLFCEICSAVHHAHQNLVVHRDLKPGNVLVTESGRPKLLDFGIAKLLTPEAAARTELTRLGSAPMTLEYASPEQVRAAPVTTASDVYSLGVLLCELLTGERPHRLEGCSLAEAIRRVCEDEPTPPSRFRPDLSVDFDSIVLKALHKKPADRYRSVEQFSDDVRAYLAGRPVLAHEASRTYRLAKFLERHKLAVAAAGTLLLAVLGVGVLVTFLWQRAVAERDRAETERRRAERVIDLLVDVFESPDPDRAQGGEPTARELLDLGREKVLGGLAEEPEVRAALLQVMGRVYRRLGDYGDSRNLLEEALRLRRRTLAADHPLIAESLHDLGYVLHRQGDLAGAGPLFEEAVAIQRRNAQRFPLELARGLTNLSQLRYDEKKYEEAQAVLREALEIKRRIPGTTDEDLVVTLSNLAAMRKVLGRWEESVELYREVLEIRRRAHGPLHTGVAQSLVNLGTVLRDLGELGEAESLLREALEVRRQLQGEGHPEVAIAHRRLGTVLETRGDLEDAATEYAKALEVQLVALGGGHPELAITWTRQAAVHAKQGELVACESLARKALAVLRETQPDSWRVADAESVLGGCLAGQGQRLAAEPLLRASYERLRQVRGERDLATREAGKRLAGYS
jgi:serine/threonine-protein kinase